MQLPQPMHLLKSTKTPLVIVKSPALCFFGVQMHTAVLIMRMQKTVKQFLTGLAEEVVVDGLDFAVS